MRIFTAFLAVMMACLLAGCGDDDEEEGVGPGDGGYTGFPAMQEGSWAETEYAAGRYRYEYVGTDTFDGHECFIIELETTAAGQEFVSQIWIDKATSEAVLFVMKQAGIVMKMDLSQIPDVPAGVSEETPTEYTPGQQVGTETYTTPTGKSVTAAIFKAGNYEHWVSSEVPFGIVKSILDGEEVLRLYDFAFSGAVRDISKEEAENAVSIPGMDIPGIPGA